MNAKDLFANIHILIIYLDRFLWIIVEHWYCTSTALNSFFFKENIFEPLAMEDTGFQVPEDKIHRLAANYLYHLGGPPKLIEEKSDEYAGLTPSFLSGGGGLFSTAEDYLMFCRMILNKGYLNGERLLSRKTVDLMSSNHLRASSSLADIAYGRWSESTFDGVGFGLGF